MEAAKQLARNFTQAHSSDAALILERLTPETAARYVEGLPPRLGAGLLQRMVPAFGAQCVACLSAVPFEQIIAALPLDRAAGLLRRLDSEQQERLLQQAPTGLAALLGRLLRHPENCAAALLDPRVLALPQDITVSEALARVRQLPSQALYYLYVIDREQKLVGVLNLRELMLAAPKIPLTAVMHREVSAVTALADRSAILDHPGWHQVHALPVVDDHGIFLGVLRYETLRRLESESRSTPPTGDALSAVLTLGELCWVGLASVLTDLTTSVGAITTAAAKGKEPTNG